MLLRIGARGEIAIKINILPGQNHQYTLCFPEGPALIIMLAFQGPYLNLQLWKAASMFENIL